MQSRTATLAVMVSVGLIFLPLACGSSSDSQESSSESRPSGDKAGSGRSMPKELTIDLGGGISMELVLIPTGEFMMGSHQSPMEVADRYGGNEDEYMDEHPRHQVRISKPFYMAKYEVTLGQFKRFIEETNYVTDARKGGQDFENGRKGGYVASDSGPAWSEDASYRNPGFEQTDNHPVVMVSWNDATEFCKWLAKKSGNAIRLPTEAEWEYACRAGTQTAYWWGDGMDRSGKVANVLDEGAAPRFFAPSPYRVMLMDDAFVYTAPVGRYRPNAFGLYDMIGNALEWCEDWYGPYTDQPQSDPEGAKTGPGRVARGGSWDFSADFCRCS